MRTAGIVRFCHRIGTPTFPFNDIDILLALPVELSNWFYGCLSVLLRSSDINTVVRQRERDKSPYPTSNPDKRRTEYITVSHPRRVRSDSPHTSLSLLRAKSNL